MPEEGRPEGLGVLELPDGKGELTVKVLMSKLKAICLKYRQAVDNKRRRGYGRVVLIFFELCEEIWAVIPPQTEFPAAYNRAPYLYLVISTMRRRRVKVTRLQRVHALAKVLSHTLIKQEIRTPAKRVAAKEAPRQAVVDISHRRHHHHPQQQ